MATVEAFSFDRVQSEAARTLGSLEKRGKLE